MCKTKLVIYMPWIWLASGVHAGGEQKRQSHPKAPDRCKSTGTEGKRALNSGKTS
jgi:hypothetical protein